jgi:citrate lyase beta subunit
MIKAFNEGQAQGKAAVNFENKMVDIAGIKRAVASLKKAGQYTE